MAGREWALAACLLLAGCSTELERLEAQSERMEDDINGYRSAIRTRERQKSRVDRQIEVYDRSHDIREGLAR